MAIKVNENHRSYMRHEKMRRCYGKYLHVPT